MSPRRLKRSDDSQMFSRSMVRIQKIAPLRAELILSVTFFGLLEAGEALISARINVRRPSRAEIIVNLVFLVADIHLSGKHKSSAGGNLCSLQRKRWLNCGDERSRGGATLD